MMERNKGKVKNILLLSNLSYGLGKKLPEATGENTRRAYDALLQPGFSSVSEGLSNFNTGKSNNSIL